MRLVRKMDPVQVQAVHRKYGYQLPDRLPEDLQQLERYIVFEIEAEKEKQNTDRGVGLVVCSAVGKDCEIRYLFLKKECRSSPNILQVLALLLEELQREAPGRSVFWRYRLSVGKEDVFLNLASKLEGYSCESALLSTWMWIDAAGICVRKSLRPMDRLTDEQMHQDGFKMISLEELQQDMNLVRQLERLQREDPQFLSPLQKDEHRLSQYSFVLFEEITHKPVSWILCNGVSEEELEISRAYTVKEFRSIRLWMTFFGSVIYRITERYPRFRFQVEAGNRKMYTVMKAYFADTIKEMQEERLLKICRKNAVEI